MTKPILLGMTNPYRDDRWAALWPEPRGCTGHRVYQMIREVGGESVSPNRYVDGFDRMNLLTGEWSDRRARAAAVDFNLEYVTPGRTVVVLGAAVWSALGLTRVPWLRSHVVTHYEGWDADADATGRTTLYRVPHPSGLNRWYNDTRNRRRVGRLLLSLMEDRACRLR